MSAPRTARERVRLEMTGEILAAARIEMAETGPAGLSLRAVARRLGMAPSALYRYFASRDALLTALIVESYDAVGEVAEQAAAGAGASHTGGSMATGGGAGRPLPRWLAVTAAVRAWAAANPQSWALLYGSPVAGYAAPELTVEPALRISRVVVGLVAAGLDAGGTPAMPPAPPGADAAVDPMREQVLPGRPPEAAAAALLAWTSLIGMVSLELFGHYAGGFADFDLVFAYAMEAAGRSAGLT